MTEKQTLSLTSTINRRKDHIAAAIDNELVVMDVEQGNYYGLDDIGNDIWQRIEEPVAISDLCAALSKEYDADINTISQDVMVFIERLSAEGLIEVKA